MPDNAVENQCYYVEVSGGGGLHSFTWSLFHSFGSFSKYFLNIYRMPESARGGGYNQEIVC